MTDADAEVFLPSSTSGSEFARSQTSPVQRSSESNGDAVALPPRRSSQGDAMTVTSPLAAALSRNVVSTSSLPRIRVERPESSGGGVPDWLARPPSPWTDAAYGVHNAPWYRNLTKSKAHTTQRLCAVTGHRKHFTPEECWSWPLTQIFAASPLRDRPGRTHIDQYKESFALHRAEVQHDSDLAAFIVSIEEEIQYLQDTDEPSPDQQLRLEKLEAKLHQWQKYRDTSIRRLDRLDEHLMGVRKQHPSDKNLFLSVARQLATRPGRGDANPGLSTNNASVVDGQSGAKEFHRQSSVGIPGKHGDQKKKAAVNARKSFAAHLSDSPERRRCQSVSHADWLKQRFMLESQNSMQTLDLDQVAQKETPQQEAEAAPDMTSDSILPGRPMDPMSPRRHKKHQEERKRRRTKRLVEIDELLISKALPT